MADVSVTALLDTVPLLRKSESPMPVLFIGHGSPMNALPGNPYFQSWQALGAMFGAGQRWPRPQLVLCISAHWQTPGTGWWLTAMDKPRTIHDFGNFPQELFDLQYPAPGAPQAAGAIAHGVRQRHSQPLGLDASAWGIDHGAWSVLLPMFPAADIPVVQLSMDTTRPASEHYALARQLGVLRQRGVLVVASGNIVHNLAHMQRGTSESQAYDWALEFDHITGGHIQQGNLDALQNFQKLGSLARMAQPSDEHYLPLLYAAGTVRGSLQAPVAPVRFFNTNFQGGSISMRSVVWD